MKIQFTARSPKLEAMTTRRKVIGASILAGAAAAGGVELLGLLRPGRLVGIVPFLDEGSPPLDTPVGEELDGRQYAGLSHLDARRLVMPPRLLYIRTRSSRLLPAAKPWKIRFASRSRTRDVSFDDLREQYLPRGPQLMECAGNNRAAGFGLIGVCEWDGVPLSPLLDGMGFDSRSRILVSGFDEYASKPLSPSVPGASWIFSRRDLEDSRAFLATQMEGRPLPDDHGAPVRLLAPGWYGCACIKWVNEITAVDDAAEPTSQMREYAARTMQHGMPERAADYEPATIDPAAMPVRIEKWQTDGSVSYRVAGIVWGGSPVRQDLLIRFAPDEPYVPVSRVEPPKKLPWTLWSHLWKPRHPGLYRIRLRLEDASVRTRRLDTGFYVREARIDEV
jgi:DMSO/TMAO reductase YedYZ molybdopterin-dependent catalytic subunit